MLLGYFVVAGTIAMTKWSIAKVREKEYKEVAWGAVALLVFVVAACYGTIGYYE